METVISKVWPPKEGQIRYVTIFAHKDGRRVRYISGPMCENEDQQALLKLRGNIAGTFGSIAHWEAFPVEDVCCACFSHLERGFIQKNGQTKMTWRSSHPAYATFEETQLCRKCLTVALDEEIAKHEKKIKLMKAMALPSIEIAQ